MKIKKETAIKILAAMLTVLMLVGCMQATVFANDSQYLNPNTIKANDETHAAEKAQKVAGSILSIVQVIAVATAVIMLIVLAIKYISSAPNDKAEIKKHAVIYVVGAVLLFGATGILELIRNFAGVFNSDGTSGTTTGR